MLFWACLWFYFEDNEIALLEIANFYFASHLCKYLYSSLFSFPQVFIFVFDDSWRHCCPLGSLSSVHPCHHWHNWQWASPLVIEYLYKLTWEYKTFINCSFQIYWRIIGLCDLKVEVWEKLLRGATGQITEWEVPAAHPLTSPVTLEVNSVRASWYELTWVQGQDGDGVLHQLLQCEHHLLHPPGRGGQLATRKTGGLTVHDII